MAYNYDTALTVVYVEYGLVILLVIATFIAKFYYLLLRARNKKILREAKLFLLEKIHHNNRFSGKKFPARWKKLDILLRIYKEFEKNEHTEAWDSVKQEFVRKILLPLAVSDSGSSEWRLRLYAAQTFQIAVDLNLFTKHEEIALLKLTHDETAVVYLTALYVALKYTSEEAIHNIITRMSKERWLNQTTYLRIFDEAPIDTRACIENYLCKTTNPYQRVTCYNILLRYPSHAVEWDIHPDLYSTTKKLSLSALKFLAYTEGAASIPILIKFLTHPFWEIRMTAVRQLGLLHAEEAIPDIALLLQDDELWVRVNAAKALKRIGPRGRTLLATIAPDLNKISSDILKHIPHSLW